MGKLGIFDEERSKWIQFDEDAEVLVGFISKEELDKLSTKASKAARLSGQNEKEVFNRMLGRSAVQGWRKVDDYNHPGLIVKGQPLSFTPENVDMLMKRSLEFSAFINENAINSKLFLDEEEEREETKNAS